MSVCVCVLHALTHKWSLEYHFGRKYVTQMCGLVNGGGGWKLSRCHKHLRPFPEPAYLLWPQREIISHLYLYNVRVYINIF